MISIAINIAETFLLIYAPEVDIDSCDVTNSEELKRLQKLDVISFCYPCSRTYSDDDVRIKNNDTQERKIQKYSYLIYKMMRNKEGENE